MDEIKPKPVSPDDPVMIVLKASLQRAPYKRGATAFVRALEPEKWCVIPKTVRKSTVCAAAHQLGIKITTKTLGDTTYVWRKE